MIRNIIFIAILHYPAFKHMMRRLVIRDDRAEMLKEVKAIIKLESNLFNLEVIAEYNFKEKLTKYYTVDKFLEWVSYVC